MFLCALRTLTTRTLSIHRVLTYAPSSPSATCVLLSTRKVSGVKGGAERPFDPAVLHLLVCPLSKKPLRYEVKTNELINEELGIAYPIIDGIPNMIPQDARLIQRDADTPADPTQ